MVAQAHCRGLSIQPPRFAKIIAILLRSIRFARTRLNAVCQHECHFVY